MYVDLALIERWLTGWSLARGLPLPTHGGGGLHVEVGKPEQLRRHVFLDAGTALQACADKISAPYIFLKAAVEPEVLRAALPTRWQVEVPGYLMLGPAEMPGTATLPPGYRASLETEHGAQVVRIVHESGDAAAVGRVALHGDCAVFDQIVTEEAHRRLGLGSVVMHTLDGLARKTGASERLLVATEAGRALYQNLGWQVLAPWSTAVLPAP